MVITYNLSEYDHPENLVIATNYEEEVFMYYLNSRVIVGFAGVNIQKDLEELPDLVLPRKRTYQKKYLKEIYSFLEKGDYEKRRFNIIDNQFNNIPELVYTDPHLFQTTIATSLNDALEIYEKKEKK